MVAVRVLWLQQLIAIQTNNYYNNNYNNNNKRTWTWTWVLCRMSTNHPRLCHVINTVGRRHASFLCQCQIASIATAWSGLRAPQSIRTCYWWESPGRKWRLQLRTDQNGVGVWPPSAPTWTRVESRSRSRSLVLDPSLGGSVCGSVGVVYIGSRCILAAGWQTDTHLDVIVNHVGRFTGTDRIQYMYYIISADVTWTCGWWRCVRGNVCSDAAAGARAFQVERTSDVAGKQAKHWRGNELRARQCHHWQQSG